MKVFGRIKYVPINSCRVNIDSLFLVGYDDVINATSKRKFNEFLIEFMKSSGVLTDTLFLKSCFDVKCSFNDTLYFSSGTMGLLNRLFSVKNGNVSRFIKQDDMGLISHVTDVWCMKEKLPNESQRVWGLANYWNFINYFYVNRSLIERNWDSILYCFIDDFRVAISTKRYLESIMCLTASIEDVHSMVGYKGVFDCKIIGEYITGVQLKKIGDSFVVVKNPLSKRICNNLKIGDVLISLNGIDIVSLYNFYYPFFSGSNAGSKSRNVCEKMLNSFEPYNTLVVYRDGVIDTIFSKFIRISDFIKCRDSLYDVLYGKDVIVERFGNVAYLNVGNLSRSDFDDNMNVLAGFDKIVFDFRQGTSVTLKLLYKLLPKVGFFNFTYVDVRYPGLVKISPGYVVGEDNLLKNKSVVVIVDEYSQSETEFAVMALQCLPNVKVIGGQSAGANGNVTRFLFPGNIVTYFSGIGVLYSDNCQTQKYGVRLDENLIASLDDIRSGKDVILDRAMELLN